MSFDFGVVCCFKKWPIQYKHSLIEAIISQKNDIIERVEWAGGNILMEISLPPPVELTVT